MKNDSALKKHHFWLLLGVVPLLTLIAVLMVSSSVGGKIAEREKAVKDAESALAPKRNPKSKKEIKAAEQLVDTVSQKQYSLHKINWERQKHLFTWPQNSELLREFDRMNLKFGDALPSDRGQFDQFRLDEVYLDEFSSLRGGKDATGPGTGMADKVAPTQFRGGWAQVLRHVNQWPQGQITKDQVWLIMEDIWVQRSLLDAVRSVNEEMAAFRRAKLDKDGNVVVDESYDEDGNKIALDRTGKPQRDNAGRTVKLPTPDEEKRKGLFRNRHWAIELELVKEGTGLRVAGTLTNISDRLQLLGVGNVMTLNLWLSKAQGAQPTMAFKIGGEYLPGKGATKVVKGADGKDQTVPANVMQVVPIDDHILPPGSDASVELVRVEQVLDIRTVPIKRIDALVLGKPDSRLGDAATLSQPTFFPAPAEGTPDQNTPGVPGGPPGGPGESLGPMSGGSQGPPPTLGGVGTGPGGGVPPMPGGPGGRPGQGAVRRAGGGPIAEVIDGNKKRYLVASSEVRRMPVGIVLVVEQSHLQDVLLAFANSPLRFQITQVGWTRFRGTLSGIGSGGALPGPGEDIEFGSGRLNFGGPADPDSRGSLGPPPTGPGPVRPTGPGPVGPPMPGVPPMPGAPGSGYPGYGNNTSTVSESQITSGLVELSIYGIVSIYEKYVEPQKTDPAADAAKTDPKPEPKPDQPMPKQPMQPGETPAPKKMRRRAGK